MQPGTSDTPTDVSLDAPAGVSLPPVDVLLDDHTAPDALDGDGQAPAPGATRLPLDLLVARAAQVMPGARLVDIKYESKPGKPLLLRWRQAGELHPNGRSNVEIDPYSGKLLRVTPVEQAAPAVRLTTWVYGLHTGSLGGWPLRMLLVLVGVWAQRPLMRAMRENMKESGDKQSVLVESLLNLELLKAHNAESYLQRRWEKANLATTDSYKKIRALSNLMLGLTASMQQLVTVGMVVFGVYMIGDNTLTLGGLIACVILAGRAITL